MIRLCLPIGDGPGGGMYSFFRNLKTWLTARGMPFADRFDDDWDVALVNSWAIPYGTVQAAKRAHPAARVLHRVDGSAVDYGRDLASDVRQALVNLLADRTVFQSRYGRDVTRRRVISDDGPVIHNPVDVERFRPDGARETLPGRVRAAHVVFSTNPRKGLADLAGLARRRPDVTFVLIGRYEAPPALPNVVLTGHVGWDRLPALLRGCEVFLFLAENETCPNVVLEALATGLPVLYRPSGGTAELVGPCGLAVDAGSFDRALEEAMDRRATLGEMARARAVELFAFDRVFPRYLEAAETAVRRPMPGPAARLRAVLRLRPPAHAVARWAVARAGRRHDTLRSDGR